MAESFTRTFNKDIQDESAALINGRGEILEQGDTIGSAFCHLFSRDHARRPCEESSMYEKIFISRIKAFLSPNPLPGAGEFSLVKDGRRYHFILTRLSNPPLRRYLMDEAQLKIVLRGEGGENTARDYLDFANIDPRYAFTRQEHNIINLIYRGLSNKGIALELRISESTVKRHIWNIFGKTGVNNRTQLIFKLTN